MWQKLLGAAVVQRIIVRELVNIVQRALIPVSLSIMPTRALTGILPKTYCTRQIHGNSLPYISLHTFYSSRAVPALLEVTHLTVKFSVES